jgi:hypothetical protein
MWAGKLILFPRINAISIWSNQAKDMENTERQPNRMSRMEACYIHKKQIENSLGYLQLYGDILTRIFLLH